MLVGVAAIALVAMAAALVLPRFVDTPRVQSLIAASASRALGRPVKFTSVSLTVLPWPAVELRGLEVAEDPQFGSTPFVRLDAGQVRLRLGSLARGHVELGDVVLKKPLIRVIQDAATGRWNFATLGPPAEGRAPSGRPRGGTGSAGPVGALASRIRIQDGVVAYQTRGAGGRASSYRIEDLDLTLTSDAGALSLGGSGRVTPGDLNLKLADVSIALNESRSFADAPLRGRGTIDAREIREFVAAAVASPITGAITGTLTLAGTVGRPRARGDVELDKLTVTHVSPGCAAPKRRTLKLGPLKMNAAWEDNRLLVRPLATSVGSGTITTSLVVTPVGGVHVELGDLAIKSLPLETVLIDFLCQGYAATGPFDLGGTLSLDARDVWSTLAGSGQLRIGPGKVVGGQALGLLSSVARLGGALSTLLAADVPSSLFSSPLDFDSITGTFQIANGVATTRDLLYTSRPMKLAASGEYALESGRLHVDLVVHHGRGQVQAKVTGTTASPSVRVVLTSALKGVDRGRVESGVQELLRRLR